MKFGQKEVYDLIVFNNVDELVANLNTLKYVGIFYSQADETYFILAKDALLNLDFLKFVGVENKQSDFEKHLGKKNTISIKKSKSKKCKLLAKSVIRNSETGLDQEIILEFPLVEIVSKPSFEGCTVNATEFDVVFKVIVSEDEFYKIHI